MEEEIGVAVFGAGKAGIEHILTLDRLRRKGVPVRIASIYKSSPNIENLRARVNYEIIRDHRTAIYDHTTSPEALLNDKSVHAVVVATPDRYHFGQARISLNLGKHVLVEKPIVLEPGECSQLIRFSQQNNLLFDVAAQLREHAPDLESLAGRIPDLERINVTYRLKPDPKKPNAGQNILPHILSIFPGDIDVAEYQMHGKQDVVIFYAQIKGRRVPVFAFMGYTEDPTKLMRRVSFTPKDKSEIVKDHNASSVDGKYTETWFAGPVSNPREAIDRKFIEGINNPGYKDEAEARVGRLNRAFMRAVELGMPVA
jgi:predicted dehydrogenase